MLNHVQDHSTRGGRPVPAVHVGWWLIAVALAATACSGSQTAPPPAPPTMTAPTPTAAPPTAAALAAYGEFWRISEAAFASPTAQDWQTEMAKVARGQALTDVMLEIRNYASVPAHLEGPVDHAPSVDPGIPATPDRVAVLDCIDISKSRAITDTDGSVIDDLANRAERYHYRAQVVRDSTKGWLVETTTPALDEPC